MDRSNKSKKQPLETGAFGYIKKKRTSYTKKVALCIAAGIAIFLFGLAVNKWNYANVFTMLAVLMVLPGAKAATALIIFLRYKSVDESHYNMVYEAVAASIPSIHQMDQVKLDTIVLEEKVTLFTDVIFTSRDKVMNLDFLIMTEHVVYGLIGKQGQDKAYMETYLKDTLKENHLFTKVKLTDSIDSYLGLIKGISTQIKDDDYNEKVVKTMETLIVK